VDIPSIVTPDQWQRQKESNIHSLDVEQAENLRLNKTDLERILPHRGKDLCLDAVSYSTATRDHIFGHWTPDISYCQDHFPDYHIIPGHWQGEMASLTATVLAKIVYPELTGFPTLKDLSINYKRPAFPGDQITASVVITEKNKRFVFFEFRIFNEAGKTVSQGKIVGTSS
jgi:3-hydroxymyristoyl/3-hydroxydecanoyl-(acyl carrier protein) dehydratase